MNRMVLEAVVVERGAMRYTPAGLPALELHLAHESMVTEAEQPRRAQLEMKAVGIGAMAEALSRFELGSTHQFAGFMTSQRNGRGLVFHVTELL